MANPRWSPDDYYVGPSGPEGRRIAASVLDGWVDLCRVQGHVGGWELQRSQVSPAVVLARRIGPDKTRGTWRRWVRRPYGLP